MRKLKITVIGSGSSYSPELIGGLIGSRDSLPLDSIYMMDIDAQKNEIIAGLSRRMLDHAGMSDVKLVATDDISQAVDGADYIVTQIRVGGLDARILDETVPLRYGLLGQETTGVGGFFKGMRTIPVMIEYARVIEKLAPDAFLINFTNPSGMITEALLKHTKVKSIGLCNCPINMIAAMRSLLGTEGDFDYDFLGLNHLSFMTAAYINGEEKLQQLIDRPIDESGLRDMLSASEYDEDLLRIVRAIPCSYLQYYYFRENRQRSLVLAPQTRGEVCKEIEKELMTLYADPELKEKPACLDKRGGARYSEAAISLINSLENDLMDVQTVDVLNGGALPFLKETDVIEIKCRIGKNGAVPIAPKQFENQHIIGLVQAVKSYERLAVQAGATGDYTAALSALTAHPLIGDYVKAKAVLDNMLEVNRAYLPQFAKHRSTR